MENISKSMAIILSIVLVIALSACSYKTKEQRFGDRLCNCIKPFDDGIQAQNRKSLQKTFSNYFHCFEKIQTDSLEVSLLIYMADNENYEYMKNRCGLNTNDMVNYMGFYGFAISTDFIKNYQRKSDKELLNFYNSFKSQMSPIMNQ